MVRNFSLILIRVLTDLVSDTPALCVTSLLCVCVYVCSKKIPKMFEIIYFNYCAGNCLDCECQLNHCH